MAYIYRYKTSAGKIVYIGKTNNLLPRINAHRQDPWWNDSLIVEFIDNLTPTDADMLETYFISQTAPEFNVRKQWGPSEMAIDISTYEWKPIELAPIAPVIRRGACLPPIYRCGRCGQLIGHGEETKIEFKAIGPVCYMFAGNYICKRCALETRDSEIEELYESASQFFIYREAKLKSAIEILIDCGDECEY